MQPFVTDFPWSVCLSVCFGHNHELSQTVELIDMPVWTADSAGPKESCIRWGPDPLWGRGSFGEHPLWCSFFVKIL